MSRQMKEAGRARRRLRALLAVLAAALLVFGYTPPGKAMWAWLMRTAGLAHFTAALPADALHVHVISVGKADAILLESPAAAVLVDCGTADSVQEVLNYLDARGIDRLDAVWISHPDSDHYGGLSEIERKLPVGEVVESASAESAAGSAVLPVRRTTAGERFAYGDMLLEVLGPQERYAGANDNSVVFRLRYGDFSMLFCGDIEEAAEQALLESGAPLQADVLKVAHHGSDTSTSAALLEAVCPQYAVISSGADRSLLPRNAVLKRLDAAGTEVFRTDTDGTVVISVSQGEIAVTTENGRPALPQAVKKGSEP